MIYLDNAATTYPKPASVQNTVQIALKKYGANPGRAGHAMSLAAAEEIYRCRTAAADFFKAPGPECVAFTLNCTHAMNYVLKGLLKPGDHVVTSSLEHNAVMRPLQKLSENGVMFTVAKVFPGDNDATLNAFRNAIRENTKLIVCTHASNVWGIRLPVERIAALGHLYNIPIVVDCAQSAGVLPIDMAESGFDYLCVAGHKGLYGPMGTGMLVYAQRLESGNDYRRRHRNKFFFHGAATDNAGPYGKRYAEHAWNCRASCRNRICQKQGNSKHLPPRNVPYKVSL